MLGLSAGVLDVVRSIITAVVGVITIIFLTFFMLLEGPRTIDGILRIVPESARPRYERVGREIYRSISGYVTGNLLISLLAGILATVVLFAVGSEFAIALGLLVAILDLIPLAGATLAAIVVSTVVFIETDWVRCVIVIVFFIAYQQFENHVVQPLVYGQDGAALASCRALRGARRRAARRNPGSAARHSRRGLADRDRTRDPRVPAGDGRRGDLSGRLGLDPDPVDGDAVDRARKLVKASLFEPGRLLAVPKRDDDAIGPMLRDRVADDLLRRVGLHVDVGRVGRRSLGHGLADGARLGARLVLVVRQPLQPGLFHRRHDDVQLVLGRDHAPEGLLVELRARDDDDARHSPDVPVAAARETFAPLPAAGIGSPWLGAVGGGDSARSASDT